MLSLRVRSDSQAPSKKGQAAHSTTRVASASWRRRDGAEPERVPDGHAGEVVAHRERDHGERRR